MRCTPRVRFLLMLAGLIASLWSTDAVWGAPGWAENLEAGVRQAQTSGKPLMVVFRCVR
ncbi:MAG: hypothetical protein ACK5EA_14500 [Planctomycetaceae bacterium]